MALREREREKERANDGDDNTLLLKDKDSSIERLSERERVRTLNLTEVFVWQ